MVAGSEFIAANTKCGASSSGAAVSFVPGFQPNSSYQNRLRRAFDPYSAQARIDVFKAEPLYYDHIMLLVCYKKNEQPSLILYPFRHRFTPPPVAQS